MFTNITCLKLISNSVNIYKTKLFGCIQTRVNNGLKQTYVYYFLKIGRGYNNVVTCLEQCFLKIPLYGAWNQK